MNTTHSLVKQKGRAGTVFLLAMLCSALFFIPYIIMDQGFFLFYGDFNVQQIPFYKLAHEAVRSGNWFWDFKTDLGTNFIGSYSFYLLGSPFFWLTIPFPNEFVPYLMGPLLILKFSCAALTAYLYLCRFVKRKETAVLGGLLYAFSGFSVYNVFFNHFHEAIIVFPLLLLALEMLMVENRKGFFLFMVCLSAVSNYFFFFGMVVFVLIYYILRALSGGWKVSFGKFALVGLEAVLGVLLGAAILLPTFLMVIQNSRISSTLTGWGGLLYGKEQIYPYIIQSFFFPPDNPARPVFFTGADVKWSSVAGWMPVFSMTGVIAYLQAKKGTWLRRIIFLMIFMALIPVLNSAFYMFNYAYYARWFYMPILMMALATVLCVEDEQTNWKSAFKWTMGITLGFALAIGFFPTGTDANGNYKDFGLFSKEYTDRFWITTAIAVGSLLILLGLLYLKKRSLKMFMRSAIASVCVVSVVYSLFFIGWGKSHSYSTEDYVIPLIKNSEDIRIDGKAPEEIDSRIDVYDGMDNVAMFFGMSSIQAFHSIVPASVTEFYNYVGVERVVGSRPSVDNYALRGLLSVQYLFDYADDSNHFEEDGRPKLKGFVKNSTQNGFDIYENINYVPYGFTYDYYMTKNYLDTFTQTDRQNMMMKAILLSEEQIAKYGDILTNFEDRNKPSQTQEEAGAAGTQSSSDPADSSTASDAALSGGGSSVSDTDSSAPSAISVPSDVSGSSDGAVSSDLSAPAEEEEELVLSENNYIKDCQERAMTAAVNFTKDSKGFTATSVLENDNLVFFSIPYDEGWSATVDGQPAEVEKVNIGFMAVKVPSGQHTIRFDYETPGLHWGIIITFTAAGLTILYLIICFAVKGYRRRKEEHERLIAEALGLNTKPAHAPEDMFTVANSVPPIPPAAPAGFAYPIAAPDDADTQKTEEQPKAETEPPIPEDLPPIQEPAAPVPAEEPAPSSAEPEPTQSSPLPPVTPEDILIQPKKYSMDDFLPKAQEPVKEEQPSSETPEDTAPPKGDAPSVIEEFDPDKFQDFLDQLAQTAEAQQQPPEDDSKNAQTDEK